MGKAKVELQGQIASMSADIVSLAEHLAAVRAAAGDGAEPSEGEVILLAEGLDLLAAYRSIRDRRTRLLLKALVETIAHSDRRAADGSSDEGDHFQS